jgi:hypothetical protein
MVKMKNVSKVCTTFGLHLHTWEDGTSKIKIFVTLSKIYALRRIVHVYGNVNNGQTRLQLTM